MPAVQLRQPLTSFAHEGLPGAIRRLREVGHRPNQLGASKREKANDRSRWSFPHELFLQELPDCLAD
jgi:hypothetical protein